LQVLQSRISGSYKSYQESQWTRPMPLKESTGEVHISYIA